MIALLVLPLLLACADAKKSDIDAWTFKTKLSGGMRLDRSPADSRVDAVTLARNFRRIAYDVEADPFGTGVEPGRKTREPTLTRWEQDIRLQIFGETPDRPTTRRDIYAFMRKLSGLTGVKFTLSDVVQIRRKKQEQANLLVLLGGGRDFDRMIGELDVSIRTSSGKSAESLKIVRTFLNKWHLSLSPCAAEVYSELDDQNRNTGRVILGLIAIRTDFEDPNTQSCIEEELAQAMGLMNDHPDVRPSMFNDDEEFALMTDHDALLLRILYDSRLRAGMSPEESMPIVRQIAAELMADEEGD